MKKFRSTQHRSRPGAEGLGFGVEGVGFRVQRSPVCFHNVVYVRALPLPLYELLSCQFLSCPDILNSRNTLDWILDAVFGCLRPP